MIKKIFLTIALLILAGVIIFAGYYFYCKYYIEGRSVKSEVPMTEKLCESNGGEWIVMWAWTNEGDLSLNYCQCKKWLIPSRMLPHIEEDEMARCR